MNQGNRISFADSSLPDCSDACKQPLSEQQQKPSSLRLQSQPQASLAQQLQQPVQFASSVQLQWSYCRQSSTAGPAADN